MPTLRIDGREVTVAAGASVLDAARQLGIDVPALCWLPGCTPSTSCLACVVRLRGQERLVPSCATAATDGLEVESESERVRAERRTALELLASEHLGDCRAPCVTVCPAGLDIPLMLERVAAGDLRRAIEEVKREVPMPGVLGRICRANCEDGCRRRTEDAPLSIRNLERFVADADREAGGPFVPACPAPTGKRVAVIGAGPTGLAAAYFLRLQGHACTVYERAAAAGGSLRALAPAGGLPPEVLDAEIAVVERMGAVLRLGTALEDAGGLAALRAEFDAVLLAVGEAGRAGLEAHALAAPGPAFATALPGVFLAGDAVRSLRSPVRAMAQGKAAAAAIARHVAGLPPASPGHPFASVIGRLREGEIAEFMKEASAAARLGPPTGTQADFAPAEAAQESERCLHCGCRKMDMCALRRYATAYGADRTRFAGERRAFERRVDHPFVVYEPGKCIACGRCVTLAERDQDALGLTFVGRGFDVRVAVPFGGSLADGLRAAAERCVEACPTGALARRGGEAGSAPADHTAPAARNSATSAGA